MSTTAQQPLFDSAFLRKLDRLALLTKRAMAGEMQGERRSPRRGSSVEFADFRPYVAGDDIRQIDWNLYARMDRFYLKLMVAEEELTIHLLVDNTASMDWGEPNKLAYARRAAGAFGYIALSSLDRVTVTALAAGAARQMLRPEIDGDFRLLDAEGGAPIEITADLDVLRRYDENLRAWRDEIESFCNGRGITYIFIDTSVPVEDFVLSTLRRRGVLR